MEDFFRKRKRAEEEREFFPPLLFEMFWLENFCGIGIWLVRWL